MKKTVLAVLGVILACAPLTQISVAQKRSQNQPQKQQQMQWREYVYPQDGFAISWPSAPTPHYDGGDRHINVYTVAMGKTVVSLRAISRLMDCETALSEMWDKAEGGKNSNEPIIKGSLKQVSPAGMKGLEYETDMGSGQRSLHRFQCADEHRFYIFNVGYAGKQRPPEADRIIKSFHVVSPAH